jgi:predicted ABC-type ATPase
MSPELYVIAGPNGIGKTTSAFDLIPANIPIINSDEIAAAVRNAGLINTNTQEYGNREANRLISEYLNQKTSFAIETNLSDIDTWKFLIETQKTGYNINVIYLSTDNLNLLNARIDQRVLAGEHYVRPDIVEERYINSLNLLNHYFKIPDQIQLFDNSKSLQLIAEIKQGKIVELNEPLPAWVEENLSEHFNKKQKVSEKKRIDMDSIEEVRKSYRAFKQRADEALQPQKDAKQKEVKKSQTKKPGRKPGL